MKYWRSIQDKMGYWRSRPDKLEILEVKSGYKWISQIKNKILKVKAEYNADIGGQGKAQWSRKCKMGLKLIRSCFGLQIYQIRDFWIREI